jgi:hypothetical protein
MQILTLLFIVLLKAVVGPIIFISRSMISGILKSFGLKSSIVVDFFNGEKTTYRFVEVSPMIYVT